MRILRVLFLHIVRSSTITKCTIESSPEALIPSSKLCSSINPVIYCPRTIHARIHINPELPRRPHPHFFLIHVQQYTKNSWGTQTRWDSDLPVPPRKPFAIHDPHPSFFMHLSSRANRYWDFLEEEKRSKNSLRQFNFVTQKKHSLNETQQCLLLRELIGYGTCQRKKAFGHTPCAQSTWWDLKLTHVPDLQQQVFFFPFWLVVSRFFFFFFFFFSASLVFAEQTDNILFIWAVGIRAYFLYTYVQLGWVRRQRLLGVYHSLEALCWGSSFWGFGQFWCI